ncbi:MAG: D-alanine--D-alanine ligase [Dehalococcoidia bacterium]|nr:D-alanine--D-alanine ligase [Dehalococcoidia bacterium]
MTAARQRLAVIFGGRSPEHEVSVVSARSVMREADPARFEVVPFGITKGGRWLSPADTRARLDDGARRDMGHEEARGVLDTPAVLGDLASVDAVFPIVHGPLGEDGTLQGLLELAGIPYVGAGVAASAIGMDKELMRAVFARAGLPQADYLVLRDADIEAPPEDALREIAGRLGFPCFVKPCNGGSSVGVSKARSREDLLEALHEAGRFDRKVIVEAAIAGREVECAVLGNAHPEASPLGEITPRAEFYTYDAKYADDSTELTVPARVSEAVRDRIQSLAVRAFEALDCAGMARVDFFVTPEDDLRVIEVNTLPGFTPISMYPRLWQEAGLTYGGLISKLVDLALERHRSTALRGAGTQQGAVSHG